MWKAVLESYLGCSEGSTLIVLIENIYLLLLVLKHVHMKFLL